MRTTLLSAAAAVALALGASPAQAQIVIQSGYSQPYYSGYQPYYGTQPYSGGYQPYYGTQPYSGGAAIGSGGLIQAVEGQVLNRTGLGQYVTPYTSGYGNFNSFGAQPYSGGYSNFSPYYGGATYPTYGGSPGFGYGRRR